MSHTFAIRADGLGKNYFLKHEAGEKYLSLRDVFARKAKSAAKLLNPFTLSGQVHRLGKESKLRKHCLSDELFWALHDVSFEIKQGERVGIVGHNGAGKSTLLKILSRITEPSIGRVELCGRVASLLEVGTGFHPELTGRENIFLNGAILGMKRREIYSKFDEIVEFAEVERFLDTPVKRYSSGMYVRLAFAVAAHLEPEILVVDEVLAVGDASFQKKCLGKMEDVSANDGRTVLFVSHQMAAISRLCDRCLLLSQGSLIMDGRVNEVVSQYLRLGAKETFDENLLNIKRSTGAREVLFKSLKVFNDDLQTPGIIQTGSRVKFLLELQYFDDKYFDFSNSRIAIRLSNANGISILMSSEMLKPGMLKRAGESINYVEFNLFKNPLTPGIYKVVLFIEVHGVIQDWVREGLSINVESGDFYGSGKMCPPGHEGKSVLVDYSIVCGS